MRFTVILILALVFMPFAVMANSVSHNPGVTCPQRFSCSAIGTIASSDLGAYATSCLSNVMGYRSQSSFFEDTALDSSNCLQTKSDLTSASGDKVTMPPHCCVAKMSDDVCVMHCEIQVGPGQ